MSTYLPGSADEVAEAIRGVLSNGESLEVLGSWSRRALGRAVSAADVLDMSAMAGIVSYEPAELILTALAGTPMHVIEAALAEASQMLAFEPPDLALLLSGADARQHAPGHSETAGGSVFPNPPFARLAELSAERGAFARTGTVGGVVATGLSGPRRFRAGAVRDHVLGMTAVSGRGEVFVGGGKVVKNVTGYDIPKLMTGSYGTLAVLTEITVKVLPAPEDTRTLLVAGLDTHDAVRAMTSVLQSTADVSGACYVPSGVASSAGVAALTGLADVSVMAFRLEGFTPSVEFRLSRLRDQFGSKSQIVLDRSSSQHFWRAIRDVHLFIDVSHGSVWRLSVPPAEGAAVIERIERAWPAARWYLDWAGGMIWVATGIDHRDPEDDAGARESSKRSGHVNVAHSAVLFREALGTTGGHATLIRAPAVVRANVDVFHPQSSGVAALSKRVKEQFDPSRVLNPGRMYANL